MKFLKLYLLKIIISGKYLNLFNKQNLKLIIYFKESSIMIESFDFPKCLAHQLTARYICKLEKCKDRQLACGDCIIDHHYDHTKKLLKIEDIRKTLNT